jgi:carbon monoxide dehydrogenase subunit G
MASIRREFIVQAEPGFVWAALRDFGAVHVKLAPGFVAGCSLDEDGAVRVVTFGNGATVRERLVACDDAARRLAYTVEGGRARHHHASAQVLPEGEGASRFVWITDVLPDSVAPAIDSMMQAGAGAMQSHLETAARSRVDSGPGRPS